jgi:DNA-binding LacI/PurR family transcriptional regulator
MNSTRPTLRTLAAEAGVSAMTFSLALRNRPEISAATRRRLQRLAKLRGYQPDPTIAKLMQHLRMSSPARGQANICGLVEAVTTPGEARHEFAVRVQAGLQKRAESLGFAFSTMEIPRDANRARLQRVLRSRGVEGVVLMPMPRQRDLSGLLEWEHYSVVSVTSSVTSPRVHSVTPNHYDNMIRACRRLSDEGYRRIGLAISRDWDERSHHRWVGAMTWQNEFGGTEPVAPFIGAAVGPKLADPKFAAWVAAKKPDVILVEEIDGALLEQTLASIARGKRPAVATLDWPSPRAGSGMDQRPEEIGSVAIEILAGMISRGERGIPDRPLNIMVDGDWMSPLP